MPGGEKLGSLDLEASLAQRSSQCAVYFCPETGRALGSSQRSWQERLAPGVCLSRRLISCNCVMRRTTKDTYATTLRRQCTQDTIVANSPQTEYSDKDTEILVNYAHRRCSIMTGRSIKPRSTPHLRACQEPEAKTKQKQESRDNRDVEVPVAHAPPHADTELGRASPQGCNLRDPDHAGCLSSALLAK